MKKQSNWLTLIISLPTSNATARMRVWRALKAMGCAVLRDGVYLLPESPLAEQALQTQADDVIQSGGAAYVLHTQAMDTAQHHALQQLFERTEDYVAILTALSEFEQTIPKQDLLGAQRALSRIQRQLEQVTAIDFFPGFARTQALAAYAISQEKLNKVNTSDEPDATPGHLPKLRISQYQGRTWATRKNMWADRMASAWLIQRFIDPKAKFLWLNTPADCPTTALGFDFNGALFTHIGERVTFEVLQASFGLDTNPALSRLGQLIHFLDVGGLPMPDAAGLETLLRGAQKNSANDDALLVEATRVFDLLYAAYTEPKDPVTKQSNTPSKAGRIKGKK